MPPSSPSVLIIRLDAIGDALALTPLLAELRARSILVDLVLDRHNADIFSSLAARTVFVSPFAQRASGAANLERIQRFGRELRSREYSHAIVATEDPGGYRLAKATGAPARIGFFNGWGKPMKSLWVSTLLTRTIYRNASRDSAGLHECEVLFALGASLTGAATASRDLTRLRPLLLDAEPMPDQRVCMQVTDKWQRLGIAFDDVVALARRIGEHRSPRFISSERERPYAERFAHACAESVECFTSLEGWKSAIASASALVAPDSGAIHLAGMIGTPTVAVFPPTPDFRTQVARWSPWAAPYRIVRADADWPACATDSLAQLVSGIA